LTKKRDFNAKNISDLLESDWQIKNPTKDELTVLDGKSNID
jgi:hypothetical protein